MNWTKEIPTVDGWYWMKDKYGVWIDKLKKGASYNDVFECWSDPYISRKTVLNSTGLLKNLSDVISGCNRKNLFILQI